MQLLHQNFKYLVISVKLVHIQALKKESSGICGRNGFIPRGSVESFPLHY